MAEPLGDVETSSGHERTGTAAKWKRHTGTLGLLLMGLATLGSSWCGYQASLWNGIQTFRLVDATAFSREANTRATMATQQRVVDAALFVEYARDLSEHNVRLAEFILARARPELKDAINAWAAMKPLKNQNAPPTPFTLPQYQLKADAEAADLMSRAQKAHDSAQEANSTSDTYTLLTVLQSAALFLAGLVNTVEELRPRLITLLMAYAIFLIATAFLAKLPIAHIG